MKKFIFAALFTLGLVSAKAQTEKGTWLLGGNISYSNVEDYNVFTAAPNVGYFVMDNLAATFNGQITLSEGTNYWSLGPGARYYFTKATMGKPFIGANALIGGGKEVDTEFGFGAQAGYALFLNKCVALEVGANYRRFDDFNIFGGSIGFQIHFKK